MGYYVKNRRLESGSSGVVLPAGGTVSRPDAPTFGLIRFNTDSGLIEFFDGIMFQSLAPAGSIQYSVDSFTGDGSTTVYTMSVQVASTSNIFVFVGSIYQDPTSAYTVNGGYDLTFTSAPPSGEPISIIHSSV